MLNYDVKKELDETINNAKEEVEFGHFNFLNMAFYGKNKEIEPLINDYFKDKEIKFIIVDVSKIESKEFFFDDMKEIIKEDVPFALYLKNYSIADPKLRYIWAAIYKDHSHVKRDGVVYIDKVKAMTTIIIVDKDDKEYKRLGLNESTCFKHC